MSYDGILKDIKKEIKLVSNSTMVGEWKVAVKFQLYFLDMQQLEMEQCIDVLGPPRNVDYHNAPSHLSVIKKVNVRVTRVLRELDKSKKVWEDAQDTNNPEMYCRFVRAGHVSTSKVENDPNGLTVGEPGAKMDVGKPLAGQVLGDFSHALEDVVKIGSYGVQEKKYALSGWLQVPDGVNRYNNAFYRHLLQHNQGETVDPESGLSHLSHALWNLMAVLELSARVEKGKKETPKP